MRGRFASTASTSSTWSHGASLGTASALASMTCWESATHSLQMYTPGPATRVATSVFGFAQNEQAAMTDCWVLGVTVLAPWVVSLRLTI